MIQGHGLNFFFNFLFDWLYIPIVAFGYITRVMFGPMYLTKDFIQFIPNAIMELITRFIFFIPDVLWFLYNLITKIPANIFLLLLSPIAIVMLFTYGFAAIVTSPIQILAGVIVGFLPVISAISSTITFVVQLASSSNSSSSS